MTILNKVEQIGDKIEVHIDDGSIMYFDNVDAITSFTGKVRADSEDETRELLAWVDTEIRAGSPIASMVNKMFTKQPVARSDI